MNENFQITLEFVGPEPEGLRFRVAFCGSPDRYLLQYPEVTGLEFTPIQGGETPEFGIRVIGSGPRDEFVLNPSNRIAFDLLAVHRSDSESRGWTIELSPEEYDVRFVYTIRPEHARYDYLGK